MEGWNYTVPVSQVRYWHLADINADAEYVRS